MFTKPIRPTLIIKTTKDLKCLLIDNNQIYYGPCGFFSMLVKIQVYNSEWHGINASFFVTFLYLFTSSADEHICSNGKILDINNVV